MTDRLKQIPISIELHQFKSFAVKMSWNWVPEDNFRVVLGSVVYLSRRYLSKSLRPLTWKPVCDFHLFIHSGDLYSASSRDYYSEANGHGHLLPPLAQHFGWPNIFDKSTPVPRTYIAQLHW